MKIGIIGMGLIGGSLGLALTKTKKHNIYCYNRNIENSKKAIRLKAADKYFETIDELAQNSDVIIIAAPLGTYVDICKKLGKHLDGKKIISDVGSVKFEPVQKALKTLPEKYKSFFVPAHPIAGKEKGGIENAEANLYKGKKVIICKTANCKKGKVIAQIWKDAGAQIELLNAKKHDEIYAYVSHYVQYLSFICAKHMGASINSTSAGNFGVMSVLTPSFTKGKIGHSARAFLELTPQKRVSRNTHITKNMGEFSRLMNSPKEIWAEIFAFNKINIKKVNDKFVTSLLRKLKYINQYKGANEFEVVAKIIADSYIDMVPKEYTKYVGTGYISFTSIAQSGIKVGKHTDIKKVSQILGNIYNELKKTNL